jgi:hypothetical protein
MGYYTDYELEIEVGSLYLPKIEPELNTLTGYTFTQHSNESLMLLGAKWYDHEEDMLKLSKKYPKIVFSLWGCGEGPGDIWQKYFKDNKMQICRGEVVFPPFNPDELE